MFIVNTCFSVYCQVNGQKHKMEYLHKIEERNICLKVYNVRPGVAAKRLRVWDF